MRLVRVVRAAGYCLSTFAAERRYLRRLAQSATPTAAEDKFYPRSSACGYLNHKYFYNVSTFCHPKGGAKMCRGETISESAL